MSAQHKVRGYTRVDLLMGIALCGLAMSLFLPLMLSARHQSRRIRRANDLHQISVLVTKYHATYNTWPREISDKPGERATLTLYPLKEAAEIRVATTSGEFVGRPLKISRPRVRQVSQSPDASRSSAYFEFSQADAFP